MFHWLAFIDAIPEQLVVIFSEQIFDSADIKLFRDLEDRKTKVIWQGTKVLDGR